MFSCPICKWGLESLQWRQNWIKIVPVFGTFSPIYMALWSRTWNKVEQLASLTQWVLFFCKLSTCNILSRWCFQGTSFLPKYVEQQMKQEVNGRNQNSFQDILFVSFPPGTRRQKTPCLCLAKVKCCVKQGGGCQSQKRCQKKMTGRWRPFMGSPSLPKTPPSHI